MGEKACPKRGLLGLLYRHVCLLRQSKNTLLLSSPLGCK